MSNGTAPIQPAPVPPSIAGIPQPVIVAGGESLPPSFPLGTAGAWLPPPQVGFGGNAPFPTPVVPSAPVPPSVAGYPQPQFATGDALTPTAADLFPDFTTSSPSPPIVFANIFNMGNVAPPSTPTTPVIPTMLVEAHSLSSAATQPRPKPKPEPEPEPAPEPEEPPPPAAHKRSHHHAKAKPHGNRGH
jgi:hypothetical protein